MEKESAIIGEYIVEIDKTGHVSVYRIFDNVMGAIREIYEKENLEIDPRWNTRIIGLKLIQKLRKDGEKSVSTGEYILILNEDRSIKVFRDYGKGNVKGALREIAQNIGFSIDSQSDELTIAKKIIEFSNNGINLKAK